MLALHTGHMLSTDGQGADVEDKQRTGLWGDKGQLSRGTFPPTGRRKIFRKQKQGSTLEESVHSLI